MKDSSIAESKICQFYDGKTIFITGATGFMGKVLVEKLLRSTNVKKIYVLIRSKKGMEIKFRLQELMSAKIFDDVKKNKPNAMSRIEAIPGDITEPDFGINADDKRKLTEEVAIVFHSAATVKFDEDLTKAVDLNVVSVFTIMDICRKMKKLEVLLHVSTAYCNPQLKHISEEVNPNNGDPEGIIALCKKSDPELLNSKKMTAQIIGNKPNTYTFTKALGESAIIQKGGSLPIAIVRPSIVVSSWKEPMPGWIENLNGPTGIIAGAGKGVLRSVHCKREMIADFVPVDVPINLAIAAAWKTATQPTNEIPVYNSGSSTTNPISWGELVDNGLVSMKKYPVENVLWYPGLTCFYYAWFAFITQVLFHTFPSYILDTVSVLTGRKPVMRRVVQKMHRAMKVLAYFSTHEWKWSNDNVMKLNSELTGSDKETFNFDLSTLDWKEFMDDYVKGTKQYVLKEDPATQDKARAHLNKMFWVEKCLQGFILIAIGRLIFYMFG